MPKATLERYWEVIAALKIRTCNAKGRHLSTVQAIRLLEEHGIHTPSGHLQAPKGLLKKTALLNQGMISLNFQRFVNGFKP
ncbi:putative integrase protein [Richelia intracellularis]|nr:putative integrase protein [Richelia intracellularis]